ncbi:hypothetical protein V6Z12_D05G320600 [Gossypium hirsutum]
MPPLLISAIANCSFSFFFPFFPFHYFLCFWFFTVIVKVGYHCIPSFLGEDRKEICVPSAT